MRVVLIVAAASAALFLLAACNADEDRPAADEPTIEPCEADELEDPPRVTVNPLDCACGPYSFDPPAGVTQTAPPTSGELLEIDSPTAGDKIRSPLKLTGMVNSLDGWLHVGFAGFGDGSYRIAEPGVLSPLQLELPFTVERQTIACVLVNAGSDFYEGPLARIPVYLVPDR